MRQITDKKIRRQIERVKVKTGAIAPAATLLERSLL
jgi:hypothetical protein